MGKKELDIKKWSKFTFILGVILFSIASFFALILAYIFFEGSFGMRLLFCIIFALIVKCLQLLIESVVEHSMFLRKPFEKK